MCLLETSLNFLPVLLRVLARYPALLIFGVTGSQDPESPDGLPNSSPNPDGFVSYLSMGPNLHCLPL